MECGAPSGYNTASLLDGWCGMPVVDAARVADELDAILRREDENNDGWRRWAAGLLQPGVLTHDLLKALAATIRRFDPVLDSYLDAPIAAPDRTMIVAGSGKETFKTFNVSTAAGILAASAGVPVVKGVSRSVSAVSGAADVLEVFDIPVLTAPADVVRTLEAQGIAFISYAAFCPSYAGRYDGVFGTLTPFSFFMPAAVLAVAGVGVLYGIADVRTTLAAQGIREARPDLGRGLVVATEPMTGQVIDEYAPHGSTYKTEIAGQQLHTTREDAPEASPEWATAVAHRNSHAANAQLVAEAIHPEGHDPCTELVEQNAALIIHLAHGGDLSEVDAVEQARAARLSGRAISLLSRIHAIVGAGVHA